MAIQDLYQDPYESRAESDYTGDPRSRPGIGNIAWGIAKNALVFGVSVAAVRGLWSKTGQLTGKFWGKVAEATKDIKISGKSLPDIAKKVMGIEAQVTGKVGSFFSSYTKTYDNWKARWDYREKQRNIHEGGLFKYKRTNRMTSDQVEKCAKFTVNKLTSFWHQDANFSRRVAGKSIQFIKSYAKESAAWYGADQLLHYSRIQKNEDGSNRKIYDIGGHIKDYVKFSMYMMPSQIVWNSFGPIGRLGKEIGMGAAVKAAKRTGADQFLVQMLDKAAAFAPKVSGFMAGTGRALDEIKANYREVIDTKFIRRDRSVHENYISKRKSFEAFARNVGQQYSEAYTSAVASYEKSSTSFLADMLKDIAPSKAYSKEEQRELANEYAREYRKSGVHGALTRVTGLRPRQLSGREIKDVVGKLKIKQKDQKFWQETLANMQKEGMALADLGVYVDGHGGVHDFRSILPKNIARRAGTFAQEHGKIFNIHVFNLFGLDRALAHKPVGRKLDTREIQEAYALGKGMGTDVSGVMRTDSSMEGFMVGGNFYLKSLKLSEQSQRRSLQLSRVNDKDMKYRLVSAAHNSGLRKVSENIVKGTEHQARIDTERTKDMGAVGKFIYNTLGIKEFMGDNSVFRWFRGVYDRYSSPHSAARFKQMTADIDSGENYPKLKEWRQAQSAIHGYGSKIFGMSLKNSKVGKMFGVDVTMSNRDLLADLETSIANARPGSHEARLLSMYRVRELTNQVKGDDTFHAWSRHAHQYGRFEEMTYRDQLLEYKAASNLLKRGSGKQTMKDVDDYVSGLTHDRSISELQGSAIKIWTQRHLSDDVLMHSKGEMTPKAYKSIRSLMSGYEHDYDTITKKMFRGLSSYNPRDPYSELANDLFESSMGGYSGFVAVPRGKGTMKFSRPGKKDLQMGRVGMDVMNAVHSFNRNMLGTLGIGLDMSQYKTPTDYLKGFMTKRVGLFAGVIAGYGIADRLVDVFPGFDGSIMDEGLTVAGADLAVKGRMGLSRLYDFAGITGAAQYMEGLMPGSVNSPLSRFIRGTVAPVWAGAKLGGSIAGPEGAALGLLGGLGVGFLQGFGAMDLTKNYDQLADIYSGRQEVPVRRGRWWFGSSGDFSGTGVQYMRPSFYPRLKSKYQNTPEGYGSPLEEILFKPLPLLDFNPLSFFFGGQSHYAERHYYSYPYPQKPVPFREMPVIGPAVAYAYQAINPFPNRMHTEDLRGNRGMSAYGGSGGVGGLGMGPSAGYGEFLPGSIELNRNFPVSSASTTQLFDAQLYNMTEIAGLKGFGLQTMSEKLFGFQRPFESEQVMADASEITSFRRSYWDQSLGEPLPGTSEFLRRLIPKPLKGNTWNPLKNAMPSWMPDRYQTGSPLSATPEAELLLPGKGHDAAYDTNMTFPMEAEFLGLNVYDTTRVMLGLYPRSTSRYSGSKNPVDRVNRQIIAASTVYDPYHDVSGTMDGAMSIGRQTIVQKIKELSDSDLESFKGPVGTDVSEMNWYLHEKNADTGALVYTYNGAPVLTHQVKYSNDRYLRDVQTVREARGWAKKLYDSGLGFGGEGYSHIDRLDVLANISPFSAEYAREENIVRAQIKAGYDIKDKFERIKQKKKIVGMRQELYPLRFWGKVMSPDAEYNNLSLNENIKSAGEYSLIERSIGSLWEMGTHSHALGPLSNKFMNYRSPLEAYKDGVLYGRRMKMWCINPNEGIITKRGLVKAKDVVLGDQVITVDGKWNDVIDILPKHIRDTGENNTIYKVKVCGNYHIHEVTGKHEVYVLHAKKCIKKVSKGKMCSEPCNSWCGEKNHAYKLYTNQWDKIENLSANIDYMVTPIPSFKGLESTIDINDYIDSPLKIVSENSISSGQHLFGREAVVKCPMSEPVNRYIKTDSDFYKLLGWYLAEGYTKKTKSLCFAFHEKEKDYIEEVVYLVKKIFGTTGHIRKNLQYNDHGVYIEFTSNILAQFFRSMFGSGAENKKIPFNLMFTSDDNIKHALRRYFYGDGHYNGKSLISATTSEILSDQIYMWLLSIGIASSVYRQNAKTNLHFSFHGREYDYNAKVSYWNNLNYLSYHELYDLPVDKKRQSFIAKCCFIKDGYLYSRIELIDKVYYDDMVYDFTVSGTQSYCGISVCYHNSHPIEHFAESYARGFMSKTNPISGTIAGAWAGTLTMGPGFGTIVGGAAGGLYGGAHGAYREITDSTYIPGNVKEIRETNRFFDALAYNKNTMLYNITGDERYKEEASSTMMGLNPSDMSRPGWTHMYRATPYQERPYLMAFLEESDPKERAKIERFVPDEVAQVLDAKWARMDGLKAATAMSIGSMSRMPTGDWIGNSPEVDLQDVKLRFLENKGMEYRDMGLGFQEQQNRVNNMPWLNRVVVDMQNMGSTETPMMKTQGAAELRRNIEINLSALRVRASISIAPSAMNTVTVVNL